MWIHAVSSSSINWLFWGCLIAVTVLVGIIVILYLAQAEHNNYNKKKTERT